MSVSQQLSQCSAEFRVLGVVQHESSSRESSLVERNVGSGTIDCWVRPWDGWGRQVSRCGRTSAQL